MDRADTNFLLFPTSGSEELSGSKAFQRRQEKSHGKMEKLNQSSQLQSRTMHLYRLRAAVGTSADFRDEDDSWSNAGSEAGTDYESETGDEDERVELDRDGLILFAILAAGDYDQKGFFRCGPKVAKQLSVLGFGSRAVSALKSCLADDAPPLPRYDPNTWMPEPKLNKAKWTSVRQALAADMAEQLAKNESGLFSKKQPILAKEIKASFLLDASSISVLASYIWPRTTFSKLVDGDASSEFTLEWEKSGNVRELDRQWREADADSIRLGAELRPARVGLDLPRLCVFLRSKLGYSDVVVQTKVQSMLSEGILVRGARMRALEEAGIKLLDLSVSVATALAFLKSGQHVPLFSSSAGQDARRQNETPLVRLTHIVSRKNTIRRTPAVTTMVRQRANRLEYRAMIDDFALIKQVRYILGQMSQVALPPRPALSREPSNDAGSPKKRSISGPTEEPRLIWVAETMLQATEDGRRMIQEWNQEYGMSAREMLADHSVGLSPNKKTARTASSPAKSTTSQSSMNRTFSRTSSAASRTFSRTSSAASTQSSLLDSRFRRLMESPRKQKIRKAADTDSSDSDRASGSGPTSPKKRSAPSGRSISATRPTKEERDALFRSLFEDEDSEPGELNTVLTPGPLRRKKAAERIETGSFQVKSLLLGDDSVEETPRKAADGKQPFARANSKTNPAVIEDSPQSGRLQEAPLVVDDTPVKETVRPRLMLQKIPTKPRRIALPPVGVDSDDEVTVLSKARPAQVVDLTDD